MNLEFIYDPCDVDRILRRVPFLQREIGNPFEEGESSEAFPYCRKTRRQIYRFLSYVRGSHAEGILSRLDFCISKGWRPTQILETPAEQEFDSAVAALFAGEYFLRRGFNVQGLDIMKANLRVPDMLVQSENLSASVEVYCPRDWEGLEYFLEELRLGILHLDVPWDFHCRATIGTMPNLSPQGNLLLFDPWQFSGAYQSPARRGLRVAPLLHRIEQALQQATTGRIIRRVQDRCCNSVICVQLSQVRRGQSRTPERDFVRTGPTLSYSPGHMFDDLVEKRIRDKIGKRQAQSLCGSHVTALIVDLSMLGYTGHFKSPYYLSQFGQVIKQQLDPLGVDYDMVVFWLPGGDVASGPSVPILFLKQGLPSSVLPEMFGTAHTFRALSGEVLVEEPGPQ